MRSQQFIPTFDRDLFGDTMLWALRAHNNDLWNQFVKSYRDQERRDLVNRIAENALKHATLELMLLVILAGGDIADEFVDEEFHSYCQHE